MVATLSPSFFHPESLADQVARLHQNGIAKQLRIEELLEFIVELADALHSPYRECREAAAEKALRVAEGR